MTGTAVQPRQTAEWQCTRCGTTNRRLVDASADTASDRCVSCHRKHEIARGDRPVRWTARPA